MSHQPIVSGETYEVDYPFVRSTYKKYDFDGNSGMDYVSDSMDTWAPGVENVACAPDDSEAVADGLGKMALTVVSVHELPKPYKARVFFVRQWIDPDGKRFGKRTLRIMGIAAFRRRLSGYVVEYRIRQQEAA
jgi:hypothetical protein